MSKETGSQGRRRWEAQAQEPVSGKEGGGLWFIVMSYWTKDWGDRVGKSFGFEQCPSLFPAWHGMSSSRWAVPGVEPRVGWLQLVGQLQSTEAVVPLWESECSWEGHGFPWIVSAPSSVGMSQMLGCASRGLGTWPETGPLGAEVWASGGEENRSGDW